MTFLIYSLIGIFAYLVGTVIIWYRTANKLYRFFLENPHNLPLKLPKEVQQIKDDLNEGQFEELYKLFQEKYRGLDE